MKAEAAGADEEVLHQMMKAMKTASPLYAPSVFWEELLQKHVEELAHNKFGNFKRTVSMKYFN